MHNKKQRRYNREGGSIFQLLNQPKVST